jgi:hypothetical protein
MTRDDGEDSPREPALEVVGKKRGRPAVGPQISTSLPELYVDKLIRLANDRGLSVSALARRILVYNLKRL